MPSTNPAPDNTPERTRPGFEVTSLPPGGRVPHEMLVGYAREVLAELASNRDVKNDEAGRAIYRLCSAGMTAECTWQMFEVDFSAIGMATDMPLVAHAYADAAEIEWHFGPTPIASTPRTSSPKEAAGALNMDVLLEGFRRFVAAEGVLFPASVALHAGEDQEQHVAIDPEDCTCCQCGGSLAIIDVDDSTMSVECEAGHIYELEHGAFDAGFDYVLEFLSRRGSD